MAIVELVEDPAKVLRTKSLAVVVFYTSWCGDCARSLDYEKKLSSEFEGKISFYRMDAEKFEPIADKYGVERYPTYVYFRKGTAEKGNLIEPRGEQDARLWLKDKLKMRKDPR